ncbi:MAG: hypothetical protein ABIQ35_03735, partial [Verrucomicrobiota bacterium]
MSSYDMTDLLTLVTTDRAEGLSLHTGQSPVVHLWGEPHPIEGPSLTPENAETLLLSDRLKIHIGGESGQSAELDSDHGDEDPGFGTGGRSFVIAHQS